MWCVCFVVTQFFEFWVWILYCGLDLFGAWFVFILLSRVCCLYIGALFWCCCLARLWLSVNSVDLILFILFV